MLTVSPRFSLAALTVLIALTNSPAARAQDGKYKLLSGGEDCAVDVVLSDADDSITLIASAYQTNLVSFSNLNGGAVCHKNNSSYLLGGMHCFDSKKEGAVLTQAVCYTNFASFTCDPFSSAQSVTSLEFLPNGSLKFSDEINNNSYSCTYSQAH